MRTSPHLAEFGSPDHPGLASFHPELVSKLDSLGWTSHRVPSAWQGLLGWVDGLCREVEELRGAQGQVTRERSSFENLFHISPIPIMQQDYSRLERWMDDLRRAGVTSLEDHLGEDLEAIRSVVPLIRMVAANPAAQRAVGLSPEDMIGPIDPRIVNPGSERVGSLSWERSGNDKRWRTVPSRPPPPRARATTPSRSWPLR